MREVIKPAGGSSESSTLSHFLTFLFRLDRPNITTKADPYMIKIQIGIRITKKLRVISLSSR